MLHLEVVLSLKENSDRKLNLSQHPKFYRYLSFRTLLFMKGWLHHLLKINKWCSEMYFIEVHIINEMQTFVITIEIEYHFKK